MPGSRAGEVVELDEHDFNYYYVRMDTTQGQALSAVRDYLHARALEKGDLREGDPFEPPRLEYGGLTRARWVPARDADGNRYSRFWVSRNDYSRGSFSVMQIFDVDEADLRTQRRIEEDEAHNAFRQLVRDRFPEAIALQGHRNMDMLMFDLPELEGPVFAYRSEWPTVRVEPRDVETFNRLYARKEPS